MENAYLELTPYFNKRHLANKRPQTSDTFLRI